MWKGSIFFVFELLVIEGIFGFFMPKRSNVALRYLLSITGCFLAAYFIPTPSNTWLFLLLLSFFFLLTVATQVICLKTSVWNFIFLGVISYTSQHLMQQMKNFLMLLHPYFENIVTAQIFERILVTISMCVVYTCIYFLFARKLKTQTWMNADMDDNKKRLLGIAVITLAFSIAISSFGTGRADVQDYVIQKLYAIVCCFLTLQILRGLLNEENLKRELDIIKHIQNEQKEHYVITKETIDIINTKCHDLKHQIRQVRKSGDANVEYLKELENNINIYDSMLKTGLEALDVILTEKLLLWEKEGITFSCIMDGKQLSFMSEADVYSLFGNALDNAIEAVLKLPDPNDRRISFKVFAKNNLIFVHLHNKFDNIEFNGDLPISSKQDKQYHGFGLKSINMLVEKYKGSLTISTDEDIFNLDIIFPMESEKVLKNF